MQSANGTDYRPTKSPRQSHQSREHHPFNASGTSLHHQHDTHNAISDDFSTGFPNDFHMAYDHTGNGVPFMTNHQDPLALVSMMAGWQDSLAFDPTITGWQDAMTYDSTMGGWQDSSSIDSSRASSVSTNSGSSSRDEGTQESFICNDECCHGRAFSSRANLRRHQNERKGLRRVYACSFCHRVFSRSTACRLHQQNGVCFKSNGWVGESPQQ
ncbi:unnamed protein product [Fusarium venenatum]|uniref:C2H2-type domain-containing protein n=1 Tax=Fusarium venenatum TaxID=56646 RepID=A0A2L2T2K4_9HYPO|nr:uncharacterized protein FVRRES_00231 [Fusarium venenatum]CEI63719.1 unnamed protein product [Fusarium venenatum]